MAKAQFFLTDSLEKVFAHKAPRCVETPKLYGFGGSSVSLQLISYFEDPAGESALQYYEYSLRCTNAASGLEPEYYEVGLVPSQFPVFANTHADSDYLSREPGLYPDLLKPKTDARIQMIPDQYRSIWMRFPIAKDCEPGTYHFELELTALQPTLLGNGESYYNESLEPQRTHLSFELHISSVALAPQHLIHTEWFHADSLASYYGVPTWSEAHWESVEHFIRFAAERVGVNLLLTPIFTPPLDTAVGGERLSVQLVDIKQLAPDRYEFGFDRLKRWVAICKKYGIMRIELAHFFTQWGAKYCPKIMAEVDGVQTQIFGWHISSLAPAYRKFLEQFVPALLDCLHQEGYAKEDIYFHVSDEPNERQIEDYMRAKAQLVDLTHGYPLIDALSNVEFYTRGLVDRPIPASDYIEPFVEAGYPEPWVYYCCGQGREVPNRFFATPSYRNRIVGVLFYLYQIKGFLHWGYNFYASQFSKRQINPFFETDADGAFPSGDAYLVYPGPDGKPMSSIRAEVLREGLEDQRLLSMLEERFGRDFVVAQIHQLAAMEELSFKSYPRNPDFLKQLRKFCYTKLNNA